MEHAGPVDGVRRDEDVFSDDLEIGGPQGIEVGEVGAFGLLISGEGDVVNEGVEPDVGDKVWVEGKGDAPGHALFRAGDAEVGFASALDGVEYFVFAKFGDDFQVIFFDGRLEPLGVLGEFEIPVLFFAFFDVAPLGSEFTRFVAVAVGEILLLTDGVESVVGLFVEGAFGFELGEDVLDAGLVAVVGCFGPAVVFDVEFLPKLDEALGVALGEGGDVDAFDLGRFHHLLAMLIDAGEVVGLFTFETLIAGEDIGDDLLVGMADVGLAVGVVDGGGDEFHVGEKTLNFRN